jgi:hypothetical protein
MTGPAPTSRRRRLPATRTGITHKLSIAGFEGYLTANTYSLREVACRAKDPLSRRRAEVSARVRRPRQAGPLAAVLSSGATTRWAGSCRRSRRS